MTMAEASIEQTNSSEEDPMKFCDPCMFSRIQKQAGAYCQVCSEYLCDNCGELHRRFKATREHELKSLDESSTLTVEQKALVSTLITCDDHSSETYTDFCVGHDIPICSLCKIIAHENCEIKSLTEVVGNKNIKADIVQSLEKTRALVTKFENIKEQRDLDKVKVQSSMATIRKEIGTIKDEIIGWAEKLENCTLTKLEETEKVLLDEISAHVRISKEMVKQLTKMIASFETLGQDIPVASFALLRKVQIPIKKGEKANDKIMKEMKCQTPQFRKSTNLTTLMTRISEMGEILTFQEKSNFLEFPSLQALQNIKPDIQNITGCTFLPNDALVICGFNNSVKVFTPDFVLKDELNFGTRVWDVAAVSNDEVIVTVPDSQILQVLDLSDNIKKTKSIPVQQSCWGVDCKNDKIYTTCHQHDGGKIKVLTRDGSVVKTITLDQGNPFYLSVNSTGEKICVSTDKLSTVVCFDSTGQVLYTYSDSKLNSSVGLLFDSYDNLLVCGRLSNNIHVVKSDGSKHQVILTSAQKFKNPYCLTYSPSCKTLVVGLFESTESLQAFSIK